MLVVVHNLHPQRIKYIGDGRAAWWSRTWCRGGERTPEACRIPDLVFRREWTAVFAPYVRAWTHAQHRWARDGEALGRIAARQLALAERAGSDLLGRSSLASAGLGDLRGSSS